MKKNCLKQGKQRGFTFIEILVSSFILSIIILTIHVMESLILKSAQKHLDFAMASNQVNTMMDYLVQHPTPNSAFIDWWNQQNVTVLPSAQGSVKNTSNGAHVSIQWGRGNHLSAES